MEAESEATRHEFQSQLEAVESRAQHGRGAGAGACGSVAQPPKFDGTTSWVMFWRQFETSYAQLLNSPGDLHVLDHSLGRPGQ
jgi:hypothetical protein